MNKTEGIWEHASGLKGGANWKQEKRRHVGMQIVEATWKVSGGIAQRQC